MSFGIFLLRNVFLLCFVHSDYLFKLLLIGDSGVGKSCLLLRFAVGIRIFMFFLLDVLLNMLDFDRHQYLAGHRCCFLAESMLTSLI